MGIMLYVIYVKINHGIIYIFLCVFTMFRFVYIQNVLVNGQNSSVSLYWTVINSSNALAPIKYKAITWTHVHSLLIVRLETKMQWNQNTKNSS